LSKRQAGFPRSVRKPAKLCYSDLIHPHAKTRRNPLLENGCDPGSNPGRSIERSEIIWQGSGTSELAF